MNLVSPVASLRERMNSTHGGRIAREEVIRRACNAMARGLPSVTQAGNDATEWAVIGSGPSLNDHWDVIRLLKRGGVRIVSVNKSHDALLEHGIVPWAHVLLDPKEWVADYVKRPRMDVKYFVASQCHDSVFEALSAYNVFLWHAGQDFPAGQEPTTCLKTHWPSKDWILFPGPTTVGLRVPVIGNGLGAARFHLIGFDSSRAMGRLHAFDKVEATDATSGMFRVSNRGYSAAFDTNSHMLKQFYDFDDMIADIPNKIGRGALNIEHDLVVYGSGMLPFFAATIGLHADPECNKNPMKVGGYYEEQNMSETLPAFEMEECQTIEISFGVDV